MSGRPQWVPAPEVCGQAREMASRVLTVSQVSDCLGISESTLYDNQNGYMEFAGTIARGQVNSSAGPSDPQRRSNDGKGLDYTIVSFCDYVKRYYSVKLNYGLSFIGNCTKTFASCAIEL